MSICTRDAAPGGHSGRLGRGGGRRVGMTGTEKRREQRTFSPDKWKRLTAAGPNAEVRNKINKGGSWRRRGPLARVCCCDGRQGELMRYDAAPRRLTSPRGRWSRCVRCGRQGRPFVSLPARRHKQPYAQKPAHTMHPMMP